VVVNAAILPAPVRWEKLNVVIPAAACGWETRVVLLQAPEWLSGPVFAQPFFRYPFALELE